MKDKVIKKQKPLPPIEKDEEPFEIPDSWEWVRLGEICNVIGPASITPSNIPTGSWLLELKDVEKNTGNILYYRYTNSEINIKSNKYLFHTGDILFNKLRPYLKKILQVSLDGYCSTEFIPISSYIKKMSKYILAILKSKYVCTLVEKSMYGVNLPRVKPAFLNSIIIPLPPLSEQQRIVSKIEELFAELDKIDKAQEKYDSAANKLREKVLNTAMRGKLVPQDPNDEPASELLKRIEDEKQKLIKEKVIKKQRPLSPIEKDEEPFEIPNSWEWVRLGEIAYVINGDRGKNYPSSKYWVDSGIPFINAGALGEYELDNNKLNFISEERFNLLKTGFIKEKDILFCLRGSLGKLCLSNIGTGAIASSLTIIRNFKQLHIYYLFWCLKSKLNKINILKFANGTAQPNLSSKSIVEFMIPLPPLQEQQRIVDKIEKIISLFEI